MLTCCHFMVWYVCYKKWGVGSGRVVCGVARQQRWIGTMCAPSPWINGRSDNLRCHLSGYGYVRLCMQTTPPPPRRKPNRLLFARGVWSWCETNVMGEIAFQCTRNFFSLRYARSIKTIVDVPDGIRRCPCHQKLESEN